MSKAMIKEILKKETFWKDKKEFYLGYVKCQINIEHQGRNIRLAIECLRM